MSYQNLGHFKIYATEKGILICDHGPRPKFDATKLNSWHNVPLLSTSFTNLTGNVPGANQLVWANF
jgi:hypothetical protein